MSRIISQSLKNTYLTINYLRQIYLFHQHTTDDHTNMYGYFCERLFIHGDLIHYNNVAVRQAYGHPLRVLLPR